MTFTYPPFADAALTDDDRQLLVAMSVAILETLEHALRVGDITERQYSKGTRRVYEFCEKFCVGQAMRVATEGR